MPAIDLRAALAVVRGAPADSIAALDQADMAAQAAAEREAKRKADLAAKVEKTIPARVEQIVADYLALEAEAIRKAATDLARVQLEAELGITPPEVLAMGGWPGRLAGGRVDKIRSRLADSLPLPWNPKGGTAIQYRSAMTADSRAKAEAPKALADSEIEDRIAQRRTMLEEQRQRQIADRKRAAGIGA
jgi:hypothetical protein